MKKLLYVAASPRGNRSNSRKLAEYFLDRIRERYPDIEIETIDLSDYGLPELDEAYVDAREKLQAAEPLTPAEVRLWGLIQAEIIQFESADLYLFSTPTWNFSIPYKLKQYIDVITQPGSAYTVKADGSTEGNLDDKPVVLLFASGEASQVPDKMAVNNLISYWKRWTGFVGLESTEIGISVTDMAADQNAALQSAREKITHLVDTLDF